MNKKNEGDLIIQILKEEIKEKLEQRVSLNSISVFEFLGIVIFALSCLLILIGLST